MDVYEELKVILPQIGVVERAYLNVTAIDQNKRIYIQYGKMYETPMVSFAQLKQLSELFGTNEIALNPYDSPGCESCDYGSDYGNDIWITNPTKNIIHEDKAVYTSK